MKSDFLLALNKEIKLQKDYLKGEVINTLYFGGGTPSLLGYDDLMPLFDSMNDNFLLATDMEITLEANPDDLSLKKLKELRNTPINRLSIGVQSFMEEDLLFMNRAHTANEAIKSIINAQDIGFKNLTIDMIYGVPTLSNDQWKKNLETAFSMDIPHLSCYCLTVEPKTAFASFIN